jgi:intracellular multiplication protein IcmK
MKKVLFSAVLVLSALATRAQTPPAATPPIPVIKAAVQEVVDKNVGMILTPEQIEAMKEAASKGQIATISQYPAGKIAAPVVRDIVIDPLQKQRVPRVIRLWAGIVTTINFSDTNGTPWLIKKTSFNRDQFSEGAEESGKREASNVFKIQPMKPYAYGNVVIELEGATNAIVFMLMAGQSDENDVILNARVVGHNPNAEPQAITLQKMPDLDSSIQYFLDGVPPGGAKRLKVAGGQADAWSYNGAMYVRTRLNILSPAFKDKQGGVDGVSVYKYFSVVPQLLTSPTGGSAGTITISGY